MAKKNIYKKSILKELLTHDALTCADLSANTGRSVTLTSKMVEELIAENIIEEKGFAPSSGGRRPLIYSLKDDALYVVAVAMDQFITKVAILDPKLRPVGKNVAIELPLENNGDALEKLTEVISEAINASGLDKEKFIGVGIGMPGFISADKGHNYTFLGANIVSYIQNRIEIPVFIENDSSTIALAEYKFGVAKGESNAMIINVSWGVGLGMILNGSLFRGNDGFAGEFSHLPLFQNGKLCSCKKIGCLETETSLNYMLETAREKISEGKASALKSLLEDAHDHESYFQAFMHAAKLGDSLTIEIISDAGYNIGRGIATLMHLLNPGKIIISGRCAVAGKIWLAPIQRAINEFCIPMLTSNTVIEISSLNQNAEVLGAATLAIQKF